MKKGTYVRHRTKPDWGVGVVLEDAQQERCRIDFEHNGVTTLDLRIAATNLEVLGATEAAAYASAQRSRRKDRRLQAVANQCNHCGEPLNRSLYSDDKTWKSCPRCSVENGSNHVFYEYPGAFGTSDARVSDETPDGAQSYCKTCRPKVRQLPTSRSRDCPEVRGR